MRYRDLFISFKERVAPSEPNEWDIEDVLDKIVDIPEEKQIILLDTIPKVWPISHSLTFSILKESAASMEQTTPDSMAEWVRKILSHYESSGLKGAREYIDTSNPSAAAVHGSNSAKPLAQCRERLTSYVMGVLGMTVQISDSTEIYTDTECIYLPSSINYFDAVEENYLFYLLITVLQAGFIQGGSFGRHRFSSEDNEIVEPGAVVLADTYFSKFGDPGLAKNLYQILEIHRVMTMLDNALPGLIRETRVLRNATLERRRRDGCRGELEELFCAIVRSEDTDSSPWLRGVLVHSGQSLDGGLPQVLFTKLYSGLEEGSTENSRFTFHPFMDPFNFEAAEIKRELRIEENRKNFATQLGEIIHNREGEGGGNPSHIPQQHGKNAKIQISENSDGGRKRPGPALLIQNESVELSDDMYRLMNQIKADQGTIPESYVSAAFGVSGGGRHSGSGEAESAIISPGVFTPYDEWDYRRHGYRKNWCSLRESLLTGVKSPFIERTIKKHRGVVKRIQRQFEMLRTQERFVRRRRSGDDLDLDAIIESLGDQQAGLAPSEKIYVQLLRNRRNISANFLVDMSNSTEGWIGLALKEALVLLCEAMEIVGDSYGIYGFSGMRRMRSEFYVIKEMNERYTSAVKERLAAISPKEYTRMGPPIRHVMKRFHGIETKSRLLVILSDGKPEDYDDYKGRYAIEDTRKALAEARGAGIIPYCITIDRESHDYLDYMFGKGNYTFVRDVRDLPARLAEVYRLLTK